MRQKVGNSVQNCTKGYIYYGNASEWCDNLYDIKGVIKVSPRFKKLQNINNR